MRELIQESFIAFLLLTCMKPITESHAFCCSRSAWLFQFGLTPDVDCPEPGMYLYMTVIFSKTCHMFLYAVMKVFSARFTQR